MLTSMWIHHKQETKAGGNSKGAHIKCGPYSTWLICDSYINTATWENTWKLTENKEWRSKKINCLKTIRNKDLSFNHCKKETSLSLMRMNKSEFDFALIQWNNDKIKWENTSKMMVIFMSRWFQTDNDDVLWWTIKSLILECSNSLFWSLIRCDISIKFIHSSHSNRSLQNKIPCMYV